MQDVITDQTEHLIDFIMKHCLWQFHSRSWDRERQNEGILGMTTRLLCGEDFVPQDPQDRCYWVDAVYMVDSFRERYPWLADLDVPEIQKLMANVKERMDFLTVTGSLNEELTDEHY